MIKGRYKRFVNGMVSVVIIAGISWMGWSGIGLSFSAAVWADMTAPAVLADGSKHDGSVLFETNCAGCHPKGGNIIKRGKTLKLKPLKKRHLDSVDAIATLVTTGKGLMSAYGETLTPEEIQAVSVYVWDQAQRNWKP